MCAASWSRGAPNATACWARRWTWRGSENIPIVEVERDALDRMVKRGSLHQGIVAEAQEFQYVELDDILTAAQASGEPPFLLLFDNIQYVTNFGALLRTAEIIGVHGVVIPEHRQASVTAQVRKASAGAVDFMKIAQVTNLAQTIEELKKQNIWVVGIEEAPKAIPYNKGDYTIPIAFVVGSEVDGLRRLTREKCDYMVQLPDVGQNAVAQCVGRGFDRPVRGADAAFGKRDWTAQGAKLVGELNAPTESIKYD